ncbi:hypothetical protein GYMLUDRAFT_87175 [Collybiopsis luxurians FD-317 M1]|uniref:GATA-type domain-containing protein n=1 Tax=Collybiopsis luxurians FD-317 M1 TaxID=944289 RepID=A0A0D0C2Q8_9AGAR|nr:hypothetical protein GYMLUDRAFT_87175 [Collybiopsis luxurians FD-317 M1]
MPGRLYEPYPMTSYSHRHFDRRPSPPNAPPIATLSSTNSPTPSVASLDRSSVSTPPTRHTPPHAHAPPSYYSSHPQGYYSQPPPPVNHHHGHRGYEVSSYAAPSAPPPMTGPPPVGMGMATGGMPSAREPYGLPMPMYGSAPMHSNVPIVYTEDAATKLSDRVRRRCFNCCTTDTSTWRRSNLSPGKVLCNKCGLFERTHSRPRPEQFPHKRGPLATSALHSRSPTSAPHSISSPHLQHSHPASQDTSNNTLPPIAPPYSYSHPPHPSLAPLNSPPSSNGSHALKREDDHKRSSWQDRVSPPISKRSPPPPGRSSPVPQSVSAGSAASTKSSRSRHERDSQA